MDKIKNLWWKVRNLIKPHVLALSISLLWASNLYSDTAYNKAIDELNNISTKTRGWLDHYKVNTFNKKRVVNFMWYIKKLQEKYENIDLKDYWQVQKMLSDVNVLVNLQINYSSDEQIYWKSDYWATWTETILNWKWDCDDYALLKRELLINMWLPSDKLRLEYWKTNK